MNASDIAVRYLLLPLGIAVAMYILVHFQLLLLNKLLDFGITHQRRTKINLMTFFVSFFVVLALVALNDAF